jgi:heme/copper-type cytochrome/quinol oxidase subunit 4
LNKEKPSLAQVLDANRSLVMVLLGVPVIGMIIAVILILYKRPDNAIVALGVILFIAVQYIIMMFFFMKRVESLAKKKAEQDEAIGEGVVIENVGEIEGIGVEKNTQLIPEEERIFDIEKMNRTDEKNNDR